MSKKRRFRTYAGLIALLRHLDTFLRIDGAWFFAEHLLYVDWLEDRALS
jgi:hypothetical protein